MSQVKAPCSTSEMDTLVQLICPAKCYLALERGSASHRLVRLQAQDLV